MAQEHSVPPVLSTFVGRDHELKALRADVESVGAGRGRLVLLAGPTAANRY